MPYVMVPVPEEHVEEAMEAVLRITRNSRLKPWDEAAMADFFSELDEAAKALLSLVARATAANRQIAQASAADRMEVTQREVLGIVRDINLRAQELSHPFVVINQEATETLPNGRTRPVAIIATSHELAAMITAAEQAELANPDRPTGGQTG